mgnify:CR=1 FL=1
MARRGILSHKLRKFFERQIWQAMQVARQIALSTKVASRAYGAPFAKNPPLRSGFSDLLGFTPQSQNTQNSSAAAPRPGATLGKNVSIKRVKSGNGGYDIIKKNKQNHNSFLLRFCLIFLKLYRWKNCCWKNNILTLIGTSSYILDIRKAEHPNRLVGVFRYRR